MALVKALRKSGVPGCSTLSVLEVIGGAKREEEDVTKEFLESLEVYPFDKKAAFLAGHYVRSYRSKGKTLEPIDAAIAATAVANDLILVTYNVKDFPMSDVKIHALNGAGNV